MYHFKLLLQKSCWVIKRKKYTSLSERNLLFNPKTVFKSTVLSILCRIGLKRDIGVEWKFLQVEMCCSESSELMNTLKECYWSSNLIFVCTCTNGTGWHGQNWKTAFWEGGLPLLLFTVSRGCIWWCLWKTEETKFLNYSSDWGTKNLKS